jgi:hypothetical protein
MIQIGGVRLVGGVVIVVLLGLLGAQNLFARPSYEMSLAAGLLCPSVAAVVTALELSKTKPRGPLAMLARGVENGVLFALTAYAVALLWGLISGFCDLSRNTLLFALGPGVGTVLGGVWGALASEAARSRKRPRVCAVLFGLAGPWSSVALQLYWFYATPAIFAFEPFVGYFSGALWDTTLGEKALKTYRVATAATLFAVYVAALHVERVSDGQHQGLRFRGLGRPGLLLLGACCGLGSVLSVVFGDELGHWQTSGSIEKTLGGEITHGRCRVVYDRRLAADHVQRFAADCDAQIDSLEAWLELPPDDEPIHVFLFRDRGQKRALMGAGRTSIAKPWRREIYLTNAAYPHPVMRHELMHILAPGRGPFNIAGSLGGWLPNPGLIEGIAEASSPRDDNLSGHQWASAMRRIKVLPEISSLMSLAFFGNHSSTSYLAAGSFVNFVREQYGAETVRRWYGGEDITVLSGQPWPEMERTWHNKLDAISLNETELAVAKERFDRPSLFARSCPHVVDERMAFANGRVGGGDLTGALVAYGEVLGLDPGNWGARIGVARCHERSGNDAGARQTFEALSTDSSMTDAVRKRALEELGDLALRAGEIDKARAIYDRVRDAVTGEGRLRTLDIKHEFADDDIARPAVVALLIGTTTAGANNVEALDLIGRWRAERPEDGTPDYLYARQHLDAARWDLAAERLDAAIAKEISLPRVITEIWRMRSIVACARGERDAERFLAKYAQTASDNRHQWYAAMVARCSTKR